MFLHLVPRIYSPYSNVVVNLIDVQVPELGLILRNGIDLTTGRPYPNKRYLVARLKEGRKALDGFVVETENELDCFTVKSRWAINADRIIEHVAIHPILDKELDMVSQSVMLWFGSADDGGQQYAKRWPAGPNFEHSPLTLTPAMEVTGKLETKRVLSSVVDREVGGFLTKRTETLPLVTVESSRLMSMYRKHRYPQLKDAIKCAG